MAEDDSSLNDELRSLINREFRNYISVPSLAESSEFGILYFCSPNSVNQSTKQSWFRKTFSWSSSLSQADSDSAGGSSANLISLGWLFDHCPDNSDTEVKTKEEPVCIHGQASASQKGGGIQVETLPVGASALFENKNVLDLGKIVKRSVPYQQLRYWMKRVTPQNSPQLFREAKKRDLYVIYEVLTAEHLRIKAEENSKIEGNMNVTLPNTDIKGSGIWKRNKECRLSRPKSMGRYNFAYKCGRVRVKKNKRHLELVGLKEFYVPFQGRDKNEPPHQSQNSSQEEDISNDGIIYMKTEDNED